MNKRLPLFIIQLLFSAVCLAQVPQTLSYQGLLTDALGTPLTGSHTVTFNFYTSSNGGVPAFARGPLSVITYQGLFTVILGNGQGNNNGGLPSLGSTQYYVGLRADNNGADLMPLVALTAVPYAFTASSLDPNATVAGAQVGTGINGSNITTGTIDGALVGTGINASNVTSGVMSGALIGSGISGSNITSGVIDGTLIGTGINATDVTGGTLNGSLIGTGINGANITTGLIDGTLIGTGISATSITSGALSGALIGTGINGSNITTGVIDGTLVGNGVNASGITSGTLSGALVGSGVSAANITGTFSTAQIADAAIDNTKLAASGIDASKITVGTLPASVLPASTNVPAGTIVAFAGPLENIPSGWLECNGQSLSSAAPYDQLYSAIGTIWGTSDATHFNVPYLLGYFLRGWSHGSGEDPDAVVRTPSITTGATGTGDGVGSYQSDALKSHDHFQFVTDQETTYNVSNSANTSPVTSQDHSTDGQQAVNSYIMGPHIDAGTRANTLPGSLSGGNESRPKNAYVIYIIKY